MTTSVEKHYGDAELWDRIVRGIQACGKDLDALTVDDLGGVEEFHIRGREVTHHLAGLAGVRSSDRVIDVGCGIGGPARVLAAQHGCTVVGVDLTPEYCDVARKLTKLVGLEERVTILQGTALDLPVGDQEFDLGWTQHMSMNVADKAGIFAELKRVVRPGGRVMSYEIVKGKKEGLQLPVPWAREEGQSFLQTQAALRATIEGCGLAVDVWNDVSDLAIDWFRKILARPADAPRVLSLVDLLGPDFPEMARNVLRNLEEQRIEVVEAVSRV
jgi:SAM-dependent methyltransferase